MQLVTYVADGVRSSVEAELVHSHGAGLTRKGIGAIADLIRCCQHSHAHLEFKDLGGDALRPAH